MEAVKISKNSGTLHVRVHPWIPAGEGLCALTLLLRNINGGRLAPLQ